MAYVSVSPLSRSEPEAVPVTLLKLSSPELSVKEKPVSVARLGVSFTPAILAVRVCVAVPVPSVTDRVKSSVALVFVPSIALSSGT